MKSLGILGSSLNFSPTPSQGLHISMFDRGFLYGDSIYEVVLARKGKLMFLEEHLDRLRRSAELLHMPLTFSMNRFAGEFERFARQYSTQDLYIRCVVTRGVNPIGLGIGQSGPNTVAFFAKPAPSYDKRFYSKGIRLALSSVARMPVRALDPAAKSGNYLNNIMAVIDSHTSQFDDALMCNELGEVVEGTTFNIFWVRDGVLETPPLSMGMLSGIIRAQVIKEAERAKLPFRYARIHRRDLDQLQDAFITSSTRLVMPVERLDDHQFSRHSHTEKLMDLSRKW